MTTKDDVIILDLPVGTPLVAALSAAGRSVALPCGGRGTCGKCRATVSGAISPPTPQEMKKLSPAELAAGVRLLCQVKSTGGEVAVADAPPSGTLTVLVEGYTPEKAADAGTAHAEKAALAEKAQTLAMHKVKNDDAAAVRSRWEQLSAQVPPALSAAALPLLRRLGALYDKTSLTAVAWAGQLAALTPALKDDDTLYGIAFDIGTTTLVGYLVDLQSGQVVEAEPLGNPQEIHGADLMSRIAHAGAPVGLQELHEEITGALSAMARRLAERRGLPKEKVIAFTAVGNTCMIHLLLGVPPTSLGLSPYMPIFHQATVGWAQEIGITGFPHARFWTGPIIGGFLGADAVAAAVAGRLRRDDRPRLLIDLGTNGEILLSARGKLLACSAAAGPAFEGVHLTCGMRAEAGAISAVLFTPAGLELTIIGGHTVPRGICGSGLVDTVAGLVEAGIIDGGGRLLSAAEAQKSPAAAPLADRLLETATGPVFRLHEGEPGNQPPVDLSQKDIRDVQLAKGAIRAAIEIACQELGLSPTDLDEILLAGGFGTFIRAKSAVTMGLLPPVPLHRIRSIGNAAGAGSIMALVSPEAMAEMDHLAATAEHLELNTHAAFQERFIEAMMF
ncbi:MAG TPA: DUF4445 domain-containing protein [Firmicutes bacterium]|nr:DUF4445 domain-containing protein [Bacillota bacterium]